MNKTSLLYTVVIFCFVGGCKQHCFFKHECKKSSEPALKVPGALQLKGPSSSQATPLKAEADLKGAKGENYGKVIFQEAQGEVTLTAQVKGLSPGSHGFHFHEKGDCQAPDFTSAGGHFNPTHASHAGPAAKEHHAGDLGNLEIGKDGAGTKTISSKMITLGQGAHSIINRSVIIHQNTDDLKSQPTGNSGPRIACGIIKLIKR